LLVPDQKSLRDTGWSNRLQQLKISKIGWHVNGIWFEVIYKTRSSSKGGSPPLLLRFPNYWLNSHPSHGRTCRDLKDVQKVGNELAIHSLCSGAALVNTINMAFRMQTI